MASLLKLLLSPESIQQEQHAVRICKDTKWKTSPKTFWVAQNLNLLNVCEWTEGNILEQINKTQQSVIEESKVCKCYPIKEQLYNIK